MSEIQDAAQIIKVSFEGAEIILKMGNTGWQFVKDICAVFKKVLDQEKLSGKTSVQKLLKWEAICRFSVLKQKTWSG